MPDQREPKSERKLHNSLLAFYNSILNSSADPSIDYQKKYLLQLLNTKIELIERKTFQKKTLHFVLRISAMFLSGATTVMLGLKYNEGGGIPSGISNIVLILTALITFLTGLAVFWDIENYWIRSKIMLNKLKEIRYEYVFFLSGANQINTMDLKPYLDKFLSSLGDEYWEKFLKDSSQRITENKHVGDS